MRCVVLTATAKQRRMARSTGLAGRRVGSRVCRLAKHDRSVRVFEPRPRLGRSDADDAADRGALAAALVELGRLRAAVTDAAVHRMDGFARAIDGELQAMAMRKLHLEAGEARFCRPALRIQLARHTLRRTWSLQARGWEGDGRAGSSSLEAPPRCVERHARLAHFREQRRQR